MGVSTSETGWISQQCLGSWEAGKRTAGLNGWALGKHMDPGSATGKLNYSVWLLIEALALKERQALFNKRSSWPVHFNPPTRTESSTARGEAYPGGLTRGEVGPRLTSGHDTVHATSHSRPYPCRTPQTSAGLDVKLIVNISLNPRDSAIRKILGVRNKV